MPRIYLDIILIKTGNVIGYGQEVKTLLSQTIQDLPLTENTPYIPLNITSETEARESKRWPRVAQMEKFRSGRHHWR